MEDIWEIEVQKYCRFRGTVTIEAESEEDALHIADEMISAGTLQTTGVAWGDPEYMDGTFGVVEL